MNQKLIVIDGNSVLHRAYHALPLLSSNSVYTNAVYGFLTMLIGIVKQHNPNYLVVAFDVSKKVFRHEFFSEYKAGRKPMDIELKQQLPLIKEFLKEMDICVLGQEGFEADDILGSLSLKFKDVETLLLTGDKDSLQLINDHTKVLLMRKGISNIELFDEEHFNEVYGISPSVFVDVKALMGDKSDNIPGVRKVGEKTALNLISKYGDLDGVYEHLDEQKGKLLENLTADKDLAKLSYTLAKIKTDMDLNVDLNDMNFSLDYLNKGEGMLEKYNMSSLIKKINSNDATYKETKLKQSDKKIQDYKEPKTVKIQTANDLKDISFKGAIYVYSYENTVFFGDETNHFEVNSQPTLFMDSLSQRDILVAFKDNIEEFGIVACDGKAMLYELDKAKVEGKIAFDLSLAAYIINSDKKDYSLKSLLREELDTDCISGIMDLKKILEEKLKPYHKLYYELELPLMYVLFNMENAGFFVDKGELVKIGQEFNTLLSSLEKDIYTLCEKEFNINSPKQLGVVLFEDLGLKHGKKTKTGYSTSAEILENLIDEHPAIKKILEYRKIAKLKGTYIDGILPLLDKEGRVHTTLLQTGTSTGRIASKDPNLQNIPVRTKEGRMIRGCFGAKEGYTLVCADYSQIELRILAHVSDDPFMIDAFNNGQDIHSRTAGEIFNVPIEQVDKDMRRQAKAVNFGICYGLSPFGLSRDIDIPMGVAKKYIEDYFAKYKGVKEYLDKVVAQATDNGYVETIFGRKRYLPMLRAKNKMLIAQGQRMAQNTPIQGSAADIIKMAMNKVAKEIREMDCKLILQVHDELIIEANEKIANEVMNILKDAMEDITTLKVPLIVDCSCNKRWVK